VGSRRLATGVLVAAGEQQDLRPRFVDAPSCLVLFGVRQKQVFVAHLPFRVLLGWGFVETGDDISDSTVSAKYSYSRDQKAFRCQSFGPNHLTNHLHDCSNEM